MTSKIIEILWILLPAGLANMAPIFAAKLCPTWDCPVDFGCKLGGVRIFGSHKTVRGLVAGTVTGGIMFLFLRRWALEFLPLPLQPRAAFLQVPLFFGFWMGFCALAGDLAKSFLKRRKRIPPGDSWLPFDQIDWAIGSALGAFLYLPLSFLQLAAFVALSFFLSLAVKYVGYLLKLDKVPPLLPK